MLLTNIYFDNTLYAYLIFLSIIAISVLSGKVIFWILQNIIKKYTDKSKNKFDDVLVDMAKMPAILYIIIIGIKIGFNFLKFPNYPKIPVYYDHIMYLFVVFITAWFISRFIKALIDTYIKPLTKKTATDLDDNLIPILSKLVSIIAYVIAFIMVLQHFGQEIGPLLAGLGIGGLAFALAAKDLLSNLFGSITILADKPFKVGQRIKINGFEGFVQEVNLRTTKLKTLEGRILYVPNAKFTENVVENVSQEWARKVKFDIGLTYDTDMKGMNKAKDILKKIIEKQQGVNPDKKIIAFTEFGAFSKNILVIYWITDEDKIFEIQDEVNMKILAEFSKAKLSMAFPTQTIEVKKTK